METERLTVTTQKLAFLWLEITEKCNLECEHCYVASSPEKPLDRRLDVDNWKKLISEASELGCRSFQFIGGEPLIHPNIDTLLRHAHASGAEFIEVFTNGTPVTASTTSLLRELNARAACSFYSFDSNVHDSITGTKGSFDKTVRGLTALVSAGVPVRVGFIEMDKNIGHFDQTLTFLSTLGVNNVGYDRIRKIGRADTIDTSMLRPLSQLCGQCVRDRLCISNDGAVFPCIMSRRVALGDAVEHSLAEILSGQRLATFRKDMTDELLHRSASRHLLASTIEPNCVPEKPCAPDKPCRPDRPCVPDCGPYNDPDCHPTNCMPNP